MRIKEICRRLIIIINDMSGKADFNIPNHELELFARCFLPSIISFYQSEEGKKEFAEWKQKQEIKELIKSVKTEQYKIGRNVGIPTFLPTFTYIYLIK